MVRNAATTSGPGGGNVAPDDSSLLAFDNMGVAAAHGTGVIAVGGSEVVAANDSAVVETADGGFVAVDGSGVVVSASVAAVDSGTVAVQPGGGFMAVDDGNPIVPLEIEAALNDHNHVDIAVDVGAVTGQDTEVVQVPDTKNSWVYVGPKKIYLIAPISVNMSATGYNFSPRVPSIDILRNSNY